MIRQPTQFWNKLQNKLIFIRSVIGFKNDKHFQTSKFSNRFIS